MYEKLKRCAFQVSLVLGMGNMRKSYIEIFSEEMVSLIREKKTEYLQW